MAEGEHWSYSGDPDSHVRETRGEVDEKPTGTKLTMEEMKKKDQELSKVRSMEITSSMPKGVQRWSEY